MIGIGASPMLLARTAAEITDDVGLLTKVVVEATEVETNQYNDGPQSVLFADRTLLTFYRRGPDHATGEAEIRWKRFNITTLAQIAEGAVTSGSPTVDSRNHVVAFNPLTERVCVIYHERTAGVRTDCLYTYSDDKGATWSTPASVETLFTATLPVPFGHVVKTSLGYVMLAYLGGSCETLVSPSGSFTDWEAGSVLYTGENASFVEPTAVVTSGDNCMVVVRSAFNTNRDYAIYTSHDGLDTVSYRGFATIDDGVTRADSVGVGLCLTPDDDVLISYTNRTLSTIMGGDRINHYRVMSREMIFDFPSAVMTDAANTQIANLGPRTEGGPEDYGYDYPTPVPNGAADYIINACYYADEASGFPDRTSIRFDKLQAPFTVASRNTGTPASMVLGFRREHVTVSGTTVTAITDQSAGANAITVGSSPQADATGIIYTAGGLGYFQWLRSIMPDGGFVMLDMECYDTSPAVLLLNGDSSTSKYLGVGQPASTSTVINVAGDYTVNRINVNGRVFGTGRATRGAFYTAITTAGRVKVIIENSSALSGVTGIRPFRYGNGSQGITPNGKIFGVMVFSDYKDIQAARDWLAL